MTFISKGKDNGSFAVCFTAFNIITHFQPVIKRLNAHFRFSELFFALMSPDPESSFFCTITSLSLFIGFVLSETRV